MNSSLRTAELSDLELLKLLCSTADDGIVYNHFVQRFLPYIIKECSQICAKRKIDPHVGTQIAHETFERVRKYKSFKEDQINIPEERKAILVYLNRISVRLFNDHYAKQKKEDVLQKAYFDDIFGASGNGSDINQLKKNKELALSVLKKLTHKEQRILLTDIEYKRHHKYLPDDVLDNLAEELNMTKDNIRKTRSRTILKLKKAFDEINQI